MALPDAAVGLIEQPVLAGEREYGTSRKRPSPELVDEIMEELEDVAGWSILLWSKLRRIRDELR